MKYIVEDPYNLGTGNHYPILLFDDQADKTTSRFKRVATVYDDPELAFQICELLNESKNFQPIEYYIRVKKDSVSGDKNED